LDKQHEQAIILHEMTAELQRMQHEEKTLHEQTGSLFSNLRTKGLADSEEYEIIEKYEESLLAQIDNIYRYIQGKSTKKLNVAHGRGPYKIAIDLDLPHGWGQSSVVVQLVRTDFMPHSIELFLENMGQWQGHDMIHRGDLTVTTPLFNKPLKSLMFAEQSEGVKRGKYSLCFQGTGPSFYISLEDKPRDKDDPCLGTVTENQSMLNRLPEVIRIKEIRML